MQPEKTTASKNTTEVAELVRKREAFVERKMAEGMAEGEIEVPTVSFDKRIARTTDLLEMVRAKTRKSD